MLDFVIIIAGHGDTKDETTFSLTQCYERLPEKFTIKYIKGDALIGRVRSVGASQFLKEHEAEYMIFVDTDIQFTPVEIEAIYLAMREGYDIVGGSYGLGSGEQFAIQGFDGRMLIDGKVHPCHYVSTGFLGISRKALLTIQEKLALPLLHEGDLRHQCYPFFESGAFPEENIYISEDWDFCNKARRAGLTVYLHTGVMVDHVKQTIIIAEDVLKKVQIAPPAINAEGGIILDLAEFLNEPFEKVRDEVVYHGKRHHENDIDWLYDLAQFNSYDYYHEQRLAPIANISGCNVLDFGCGIGTAAMRLSLKNKVVGYDINPKCIEFAKYRAAKHRFINANFTTEEVDLTQFDIITFIDVLEHFEDLRTFLINLGTKLKAGTKIYHFDAFFDHATEGHFDHSARVDEYLKEAGFAKFDMLWCIKV